ncbi:MAG: hypothetical protein RIR69_741 [Actinomycetota bacterium]|jgi:hypothetical protein
MKTQRDRIHALLALAQHPNTPQAEAETALAMASKLMQKHGLSDDDITDEDTDMHRDVVVRVFRVPGAYRVRRVNILNAIALMHSCVGYRDFDDNDACVMVLYGRDVDITAAYTLFCAADLMGARLLPKGNRSWRTEWWNGFQRGIQEALQGARREFIEETPGAGLVLADRMTRARDEMRASAPPLRGGYTYSDTSSSAYNSGKDAGRGFTTGNRSFTRGVRGELH